MPTILQFSNNSDYMLLVKYFIRDTTHGTFHVEAIPTADSETAIAQYQGIAPIPIVLVEYPRDATATIQQLRAHPSFADAIILIITGRPTAFQTLTSATVMIGGKAGQLHLDSCTFLICFQDSRTTLGCYVIYPKGYLDEPTRINAR